MWKSIKIALPVVVFCFYILIAQSPFSVAGSSNNTELTPELVIAEHIKSIGGTATLSSVESRAFVGSTDVEFVQGMTGSIKNGKSSFVSAGDRLQIIMRYGAVDYPEEYIAYNGDEVSVGHIAPGQRSPLADFFYRFNGVMKKGFIGGTLSLAWPFLDNQESDINLKYKKVTIDGKELHRLEWPDHILGNIKVKMYFEPETFHHVRTEYVIRIQEDVSVQADGAYLGEMGQVDEDAGTVGYSSMMNRTVIPESIYMLIEKFDDYKTVSGMTLPHKYYIEYSIEGQGHSFIGNWTIFAQNWIFNRKFDDKIFQAQK